MVYRIIIFLILALLPAACAKEPPVDTTVLRVALEDAPKTLDPRYATDAYGMRITHQLIFSTLLEYGFDLRIEPGLAESWETLDDTVYIFHLRDNVYFHDGTRLTAEDVKFTFEHLMAPATKSPFAGTYNDTISSIEVVDPTTVKFTLKRPYAAFLSSVVMPILPKKLIENGTFAENLVGSGPFKFKGQKPGSIELVANEKYFGGVPKVKRILFKVIKDDNTRFLKMKKGNIDLLINAIAEDKIDDFGEPPLSDMYNVIEEAGISYNYLALNLDDPKLKDVRVRAAIAYALDVDEIIKYRMYGHAVKATGLLSPVNWFYEPDVTTYPHDTAKAISLLDEAGLVDPDGDGPAPRLSLELKTSNKAQVVSIARIMQSQLAKAGIKLEIKAYEWGTFYGDIKAGNFQMAAMRWVGITEPDFYYDIFHSSQVPPLGRNRGHYVNRTLDRFLEAGRGTMNPERRKAIYGEVQKIISRDLPYISLWHPHNISIINKRVVGYRQHPMGNFSSFKDISLN